MTPSTAESSRAQAPRAQEAPKRRKPLRPAKPPRPKGPKRTQAADLDRIAFEALCRRILAGGLTWVQVDARWPATCEALAGCDPGVVASLDDEAVRRIAMIPHILRNAEKLRACVENARAFQELVAEHGSFHAWLVDLRPLSWEERADALSRRFKLVRERRAWRFLREIGEPVPVEPPWLDR